MKLINSYLTERKQRVKINDQFSSWLDIVVGVPQGSILGPLLFNIFLCDMFLFCDDINFASYADDNTPYCIGKTPEEVTSQLEKSSKSKVKMKILRQILMKIEFLIQDLKKFSV